MSPECNEVIYRAIGYIGRQSNHWTSEQFQALFKEPLFKALERDVYDKAETEDVEATKDACRAWWGYVLAFTLETQEAA